MSRTKTRHFNASRVARSSFVVQFYFESFTSFFPASHFTAFVLYS